MKLLTMIFVALMSTTAMAAQNAEVPNCWLESGVDLYDGMFTVGLDAQALTSKELLAVMGAISGRYITARAYPVVFDDRMFISVQAVDNGVGAYKLSRAKFKAAAKAELGALLQFPGVSMECNAVIYPQPAVTIRN